MDNKAKKILINFVLGITLFSVFLLPAYSAEKNDSPPYIYGGDKYRDPFIPLNSKGYAQKLKLEGTTEWTGESLEAITLKGIVIGKKERCALLKDALGMSYFCKGSRVFDYRGQLIKGVASVVKDESVVFIMEDKSVKEIKLRKEEQQEIRDFKKIK